MEVRLIYPRIFLNFNAFARDSSLPNLKTSDLLADSRSLDARLRRRPTKFQMDVY